MKYTGRGTTCCAPTIICTSPWRSLRREVAICCITEREINSTGACIHYLSNLEKIQINVVPAEMHSFVFEEWLAPDEFLKRFPEDVVDLAKDGYGEIWVRSC